MAKSPSPVPSGTRIDDEPVFGDEDVPVNQTTSFNGVLNKYVHVSETTTSTQEKQETKRHLETTETQTTPKRRKPTSRTVSMPDPSSESTTPARMTRSKSRSSTPASLTTTPSRSDSKTPSLANQPSTPSRSKRQTSRSSRGQSTSASPSALQTSLLQDTIPPNLTLLLVGVNPGIMTGTTGYAYAHPSNLFWKLLHWSGITTVRHPPSDTYRLPELYNVGNTNIVVRPTRDASMLSKAEMDAGVPVLESKVADKKPAAVCLVGKSIWEAVWRARKGRGIKKEEFLYGWQDERENMGRGEGWEGARVFVATTTSGLAAGMTMGEKQAVWNELGRWVVERRARDRAQAQDHAQESQAQDPT